MKQKSSKRIKSNKHKCKVGKSCGNYCIPKASKCKKRRPKPAKSRSRLRRTPAMAPADEPNGAAIVLGGAAAIASGAVATTTILLNKGSQSEVAEGENFQAVNFQKTQSKPKPASQTGIFENDNGERVIVTSPPASGKKEKSTPKRSRKFSKEPQIFETESGNKPIVTPVPTSKKSKIIPQLKPARKRRTNPSSQVFETESGKNPIITPAPAPQQKQLNQKKKPSSNYDERMAKIRKIQQKRKLERNLKEKEAEIRNLDHEVGIAFDENGTEIFRQRGNYDYIEFSPSQISKMNGATFTHNHPPQKIVGNGGEEKKYNNSTFSVDDIKLATKTQLVEMRAVGKDYVFSMKPGKKGWNHDFEKVVNPVYQTFKEQEYSRQLEIIMDASNNKEDYDHEQVHHVAWLKAAKTLGYKYKRTPID